MCARASILQLDKALPIWKAVDMSWVFHAVPQCAQFLDKHLETRCLVCVCVCVCVFCPVCMCLCVCVRERWDFQTVMLITALQASSSRHKEDPRATPRGSTPMTTELHSRGWGLRLLPSAQLLAGSRHLGTELLQGSTAPSLLT